MRHIQGIANKEELVLFHVFVGSPPPLCQFPVADLLIDRDVSRKSGSGTEAGSSHQRASMTARRPTAAAMRTSHSLAKHAIFTLCSTLIARRMKKCQRRDRQRGGARGTNDIIGPSLSLHFASSDMLSMASATACLASSASWNAPARKPPSLQVEQPLFSTRIFSVAVCGSTRGKMDASYSMRKAAWTATRETRKKLGLQ